MKRVLIFSVAFHPFVGGAEVAVKEITDRVKEIEFEMITLNLDDKQLVVEKCGNVLVHRIGGKGRIAKLFFPFTAWFHARRLERERAFNATWSIMASYSGFAALFFSWSNPRIPFILTLQEGDSFSHIFKRVWFLYPLFKAIFLRATIVQSISNYLASFARDMGVKRKIVVIPNGVNVALFSAVQPESVVEAIRREIHKNPGDTFLVTTSRLTEKNGIVDVIDALPLLPKTVKFLIIGNGELLGQLKERVQVLGLDERVVFKGFVEYARIPEYLAACDIFIRSSLSEGLGNSFIEAMAARVPVVGTYVGGIPDFLIDRVTGLVCRVRDPGSIAEAVTVYMTDVVLREAIQVKAQALVAASYDWDMIAERMNREVFDAVLL